MPTFSFSETEIRDLTTYFQLLVPGTMGYESGLNLEIDQRVVDMGVKMTNYMDCGNCHEGGEKGIDFSIASQRLRKNWIPKWLKDTRELIPTTRMPAHWVKKEEKYVPASKFDSLNEVYEGDVDRQVADIRDFIVAYNSAEFDPDLSLESEEEEEEEDEEEGDDAEEDEEGNNESEVEDEDEDEEFE